MKRLLLTPAVIAAGLLTGCNLNMDTPTASPTDQPAPQTDQPAPTDHPAPPTLGPPIQCQFYLTTTRKAGGPGSANELYFIIVEHNDTTGTGVSCATLATIVRGHLQGWDMAVYDYLDNDIPANENLNQQCLQNGENSLNDTVWANFAVGDTFGNDYVNMWCNLLPLTKP